MKGIWNARRQKGFTLVELLVVIAIIGVLATLVLLQLGSARGRARDTQRITHVNQIRTAVEQFYEDNGGSYPADIYAADALDTYIARVPTDPLTDEDYGYAIITESGKNVSFVVWAGLEQNAAALKGDADFVGGAETPPGVSWDVASGTLPSAGTGTDDEQCAADPSQDVCIYDQGVIQ